MKSCIICGKEFARYITKNNEYYCNECLIKENGPAYLEKIAKETRYSNIFGLDILRPECNCCKKKIISDTIYHIGRRQAFCENCISLAEEILPAEKNKLKKVM